MTDVPAAQQPRGATEPAPLESGNTAGVLRALAAKLRALAENATPGRWEIEYSYRGHEPQAVIVKDPEWPDDPDMSIGIGSMDNPADNEWAAVMSPVVAAPLVEWLEIAAAAYEVTTPGVESLLPREIQAAAVLARAVVGGQS